MVDVAEDAEAEFGVLVEDLSLGDAIVEMGGHKILVLEDLLDERADLLAALDPRILRQDPMTFAGELLERIAH
jgi:hypothetical protein